MRNILIQAILTTFLLFIGATIGAAATGNSAPVPSMSPNPVETNEDTPLTSNIFAEDVDADNLTFIITDQPDHGTLSSGAPECQIYENANYCNLQFTYTPNANFNGSDSFSFKANDGQIDSEIFVANIRVLAVPDILTVTKTADTNDGVCDADCSLREAIGANTGDTVEFASPLFDTPQTITLADAPGFYTLAVNRTLDIKGRGANLLTVRRAPESAGFFRLFLFIGASVTNVSGMTITGGNVNENASAMFIQPPATLTLTDCHITGNNTNNGSGTIMNRGRLTLERTTVSNNTAAYDYGGTAGILHDGGILFINNSTISGNVKTGGTQYNAGGIYAVQHPVIITNSTITDNRVPAGTNSAGGLLNIGEATVSNTIIAANRNNSTMPDVAAIFSGAIISNGYNLIGNVGSVTTFNQTGDQTGTSAAILNPRLDPLANYGGQTPTHRLQVSPVISPGLDKGKSFGAAFDQRGSLRPADNNLILPATGGDDSDIGAYEEDFPIYVTKIADTNDGVCDADCSLREAIAAAPFEGKITFDPSFFNTPQTITLSDAAGFRDFEIDKNLTITGRGAHLLTVRRAPDAAANFRIFNVRGIGRVVNLSGMTITGGNTGESPGGGIANTFYSRLTITDSHITGNNAIYGGGLFNDNVSSVTLLNTTVSNNTANCICGGGAGINNDGELTLTNSTVSGNVKTDSNGNSAGGIYNFSGAVIITNSTITDNATPGTDGAGGIFRAGGTITVRNTIVAGNRNNSTVPDVAGEFVSANYNLIGNRGTVTNFNQSGDQTGDSSLSENRPTSPTAVLNPRLDPLANYGAAVPTHRLQSDSPAIDKGSSFGLTTDQRGLARPFDVLSVANLADGTDIGAFEVQLAPTSAMVSVSGKIMDPDGIGLRNARVALTDGGGNTRTVITGSFGYYRFDEIQAGETYIISVVSKRFQFAPQVVAVNENITELNFFGN